MINAEVANLKATQYFDEKCQQLIDAIDCDLRLKFIPNSISAGLSWTTSQLFQYYQILNEDLCYSKSFIIKLKDFFKKNYTPLGYKWSIKFAYNDDSGTLERYIKISWKNKNK